MDSELYLPSIKLEGLTKISNKYNIEIATDTSNNILNNLIDSITVEQDGESNVNIGKGSIYKLKWNISSPQDVLYHDLSGSMLLGYASIRFRLNFSGGSILANLDKGLKLTDKPPLNNNTLGGNYNTIIMNSDSDFEYLICESLPFENKFTDEVIIKIISDNENVFKTKTYPPVLLSNTNEVIRLQRMGDPRDYFSYRNLIKLECSGHGIAKLSFEVSCNNPLLDKMHIEPIYIVGITIKPIITSKYINKAKGNVNLNFELLPKDICHKLMDYNYNTYKDYDVWNDSNKSKILIDDDKDYGAGIIQPYLDETLYMIPDNDISFNNYKVPNYNLPTTNFDLHFTKKNNILVGEIEPLEKKTVNASTFSILIKPKTVGKLDLISLVDSKQILSPYFKKNMTFNDISTNLFKSDYVLINNNNLNAPKYSRWPAKYLTNDFDYKNNISLQTNNYNEISNGGPNFLICGEKKEYGWSNFNNINNYDSTAIKIENLEQFVEEKLKNNKDDDICKLFFGKLEYVTEKNSMIFNKHYWAEKIMTLNFMLNRFLMKEI